MSGPSADNKYQCAMITELDRAGRAYNCVIMFGFIFVHRMYLTDQLIHIGNMQGTDVRFRHCIISNIMLVIYNM